MDYQEVFNKFWAQAKSMKNLAKVDNGGPTIGRARYRAPNGESCLIGAFIPNKLYTSALEFRRFSTIFYYGDLHSHFINLFGINPTNSKETDFIDEIQRCHDNASSLDEMFVKLNGVAHHFHLTVPA